MTTATDFFCGGALQAQTNCAKIMVSARTKHAGFLLPTTCTPHTSDMMVKALVLSASRAVLADVQVMDDARVIFMNHTIVCAYCGKEATAKRRDKKYCSEACYQAYKRHHGTKIGERACKECGTVFKLENRADANRRYCSRQCAKNSYAKQQSVWHFENPDVMKRYNETRLAKEPDAWKRKDRLGRAEAIELLGGQCVVCGASNPNWLHIDFIPTQRGLKYRHPRHIAYIRTHLHEFRLLCANHHYELTLTGKIEGTDITQ